MEKKLVIIFDPAHGIDVAGKRSPDGKHREYLWSREIISRLTPILKDKGYRVESTNIGEKEIGLLNRQKVATKLKVNPGQVKFMISIHNNAAGMGDKWLNARGASIWTSKGQTRSDEFAELIYSNLIEDFKTIPGFPQFRRAKPIHQGNANYEENFTVLMGSDYYAILLEWLFQDNKEDVELLHNVTINDILISSLIRSIDQINDNL